MDLKELGQLLRLRREEMRVSISDISESTRISRSVLTVFEQGDVDQYPHPVYAKGFIRNYARALGIDPEECVQVLERELQIKHPRPAGAHKGAVHGEDEQASPLVKRSSPWPVLLGAVVLMGVLAVLIWYFSFYSGREVADVTVPAEIAESSVQPVSRATDQVVDGAAGKAAGQIAGQVSEQAVEQAVEQAADQMPEQAKEQAPELATELANGQAEAAGADQTLSAGASAAGGQAGAGADSLVGEVGEGGLHMLTVTAVGDAPCWVGVWIPGQEDIAKDFTVSAGESVNYRFSGERIIRFGRMETVRLRFDGADLKTEGVGVVNLTLP